MRKLITRLFARKPVSALYDGELADYGDVSWEGLAPVSVLEGRHVWIVLPPYDWEIQGD